MTTIHHLRSLQALEAAMRLGSLRAAADELGVTAAAAGQRIKALEDYLGVDLMARGRSGLRPSPQLGQAMPDLTAAFRALDRVADVLELQRVQEIHIAAPQDFVDLWLEPRLARYRAQRPNLQFCINGEGDAPHRLGRIDCGVSFGPVTAKSGHLLFHDYLVPIGSQDTVARVACLPARRRLEGFPLLHLDFYRNDPSALNWPNWVAAHQHTRNAPTRGIRFQRIAPGIDAVLSNAGFMICGIALVYERIDDKSLRLPFGLRAGAATSHAFQARFREDADLRPPLRAFREWLLEQAGQTSDWLHRKTAGARTSPNRRARVSL
jgi:LysR family glycine cleavage system transcriptional activator